MENLILDLNAATLFVGKTTTKVIVEIKPFDNHCRGRHFVKLLNEGKDYTTVHKMLEATMFDNTTKAEQFAFANNFFIDKKN